MTVTSKQLEQIADGLMEAYESSKPIRPITAEYDIEIELAYDIQSQFIERRLDRGQEVIGHKIGLTNQRIQNQLGVDEPDYGVVLDDMLLTEQLIPTKTLIEPRVEPEIGFILAEDLIAPVSYYDVLQATHSVIPLIEVIDSRICNWDIQIEDTIADNASSAFSIAGERLHDITGKDLSMEGVKIYRNGKVVDHGLGAGVLQHPAKSVAWLANKLDELGESLSAGELVLSGSLTPAVDLESGDTIHAEFTTIGSVTCRAE